MDGKWLSRMFQALFLLGLLTTLGILIASCAGNASNHGFKGVNSAFGGKR